MLLLVFHVKEDSYAIDTRNVVEVIPLMRLQSLTGAPEYVAGIFNYRGASVPVIDLCRFFKDQNSNRFYDTRMILVNYKLADQNHVLGLIAEKVSDVVQQDESQLQSSGMKLKTSPFLGKVLFDNGAMIQNIELDNLLPDELSTLLFSEDN